jgi:uncharacterized integral membrane protein (TIGR00698 family)
MVVYPAFIARLHLHPLQIGRFLGGSIHDVAQVVAAGYASSPKAGDAATIVQLMRVTMLLPVVLVVSACTAGKLRAVRSEKKVVLVPGFLIAFIVLATLNSLHLVPRPAVLAVAEISKWLLVISVAALEMKTSARDLMSAGSTAIGLVAAETGFLALLVLTWILTGH